MEGKIIKKTKQLNNEELKELLKFFKKGEV